MLTTECAIVDAPIKNDKDFHSQNALDSMGTGMGGM